MATFERIRYVGGYGATHLTSFTYAKNSAKGRQGTYSRKHFRANTLRRNQVFETWKKPEKRSFS